MAQTQRSCHCSCSPYQKAHGCFRSPQSSSCRTLLGGEGGQLSLTGANASQLSWIFMQMHPTSLLPPQDTQVYKKNPVLTHVGGCSTQELNTKLENTITAIIPGGEPLLDLGRAPRAGAAPHLRLSNVSVRTQPSKARLQGNPPWESTHLSSLSLKNNCFPS